MANLISILVVSLFVFNGLICDYFTIDLVQWWTLRTNLYALIFGLSLYLTTLKHNLFSEFICLIGLGFACSDIVDRVFFSCNYFTWTDIIMIILTVLTSYYKVYVRQRR
jgi:hypothetical protein